MKRPPQGDRWWAGTLLWLLPDGLEGHEALACGQNLRILFSFFELTHKGVELVLREERVGPVAPLAGQAPNGLRHDGVFGRAALLGQSLERCGRFVRELNRYGGHDYLLFVVFVSAHYAPLTPRLSIPGAGGFPRHLSNGVPGKPMTQ